MCQGTFFFEFQIDFGKWKRYYKIINKMLKQIRKERNYEGTE